VNGSAEALARLRSLHRDGQLVESYDEVRPLFDVMSEEDRLRAAVFLGRVEADAVRARHPKLPLVKVAVTGHGTLTMLATGLTAALAGHGFVPDVHRSDFDSYVFDLGDPGSDLYNGRPDVTICVLDHATVFDEVAVAFTAADVERVLAEKLALWRRLAQQFTRSGSGVLVLNTVPLPKHWADQLLDYPSKAKLGAVWRAANAELLGLAGGPVVVLDLDPLLGNGIELVDPRFEVYTHANLSDGLQAAYARELGHLVRARSGRSKKVLALDLDETLWGGVLGDDGPEGIEVAGGHRGAAFHQLQRTVKQLQSQGVLLAAMSKNDQDQVVAVLRDHREMVLRDNDFAHIAANWQPKPGNLRALTTSLNLATDSVVFVDDSAYECALMRGELPEVAVVQLDDEPALHVRKLLADGWFTAMEITAEDRVRTRLYQEESARAEFLSATGSIEEFLAALDVAVTLAPVAAADVARLSQLTLRTNQFNLTTERLQQTDVQALAAGEHTRVLSIAASDRFGSNGIVGAIMLRAQDDELHIDNFLLSCRVFSRGIEQACLASVLREARDRGYRAVYGAYRPTPKNAKVKDLYPHYGFAAAANDSVHRHDLAEIVAVPPHVTLRTADDLLPGPRAGRRMLTT
jgi:FkbH-like protein